MLIKNGLVFGEDCIFKKADLVFEGERIVKIAPASSTEDEAAIDAEGGFVLPGFVDIHTHGCAGSDMCDAEPEGIKKMLECYGKTGVTSVVPATMSYNQPILADIIKVAQPFFGKDGFGAVLRGINMEGPFISPNKAGAQNPEYIMDPDFAMFDALYELSLKNICLVDIAPELATSLDFIAHVKDRCTVSIAHTTANYSQTATAFDAGAKHVTHLFNAMPPFAHREPGVIGAAFDKASHVEIISDGVHLHPSVVRSVFKWFGENRVCLVSDSMRGTGLPDGEYDLGGQMVLMQKGRATLLGTDTIAGSATNLADCCRRAVQFGVAMEHAIRAATINPAFATGLQNTVGSFLPGKQADIVIWDKAMQTKAVFASGKQIFKA